MSNEQQPTAEDIAAYEAQVNPGAPPPLNPLKDLSKEDLSALAVNDKNFNIADEFQRQPDLHADPAQVQKIADALNTVKQRGFSLQDLPTVPEAGKAVGSAVKGLAGQIWNYANVAGNIAAGAVSELAGAEGLASGYAENISKRLAENVAGTEEAMTGLAQLGQKAIGKTARTVGIAKDFSNYTPAEKVTDLFNEAGKSEVRTERLSGKGEFTKAVTHGESAEANLNPEKVAELAAGDPFSFYLFGRTAGALGSLASAATPTIIKSAAGAATRGITQAAEAALPKIVGGGLTAASVTAKGVAKAVEKTAPVVAPVTGAIAGGNLYGLPGVIGGLAAGSRAGSAIARGAAMVGRGAENLASLGRQVSGNVGVTSATAQLGRDVLQAIPGAAGEVAKGAALDLGLAAATAEIPQDTAGAVGFGTALGALAGAGRLGGRVLSGQIIGPREYGVNKVLPSSGQFPGFDTMHADAMQNATPGVRARLNAVRQFVDGAAPGTDIFLARDANAVEQALQQAGVAPATAQQWAQQSGFLTTSLPGRNGQPRRVAIVRDVDSAPHEAFHAIQDVLGEQANQRIDSIIQEAYAPQWEAEGQRYADRLGDAKGAPWRDVILDASGWGLTEAKEKIYRDIANRVEGETGAAPAPRLVEEMAKAELGQRMDEALARGQGIDPNDVARHVWRDILSPEEITRVSDQYIAREIAAENFDALLKNQGPRLTENTGVLPRLARIVGGVVSAFGGEPLATRTSEFGNIQLRTPIVEAVKTAAKGERPEIISSTPRTPIAQLPLQRAATEARTLAAEAPEAPLAGGTRSPRELLGQIAEAIATQEGVKLNYLSAPGEPAAATSSNRTTRRAVIEAFRTMPPEAKALWEKTFFPERVIKTKSGQYQIQGWAPEVFASNAHKLAKFFADTSEARALSPYAIDEITKTFTPEAWQELYADTQNFVQNQMRGATGAGEPLVVPKSVTDAGGYQPPTKPGAIPLDQTKADFINLLFNFKLPETPRIQSGKRPLNIIGQEVSAATKPERVSIPVRPRGEFVGPEAERQGISGRSIAEVNPLRNQIEATAQAAGKAMPSLIEVIQKLNLENIKEVEGVPEQPQFRGNTLTLTAGFQPIKQAEVAQRDWRISGQVRGQTKQITVSAPDIASARKVAEAQGFRVAKVDAADRIVNAMFQPATAAGRDLVEKKGYEIRQTGRPDNPGISILKDGLPVGDISAIRTSPTEADIALINVDKDFRGKGLSEILYRELGARLQQEGVENVTGMIVNPRALASRTKVFPDTKIENQIENTGNTAFEVRSPIRQDVQFQPEAAEIAQMPVDDFKQVVLDYKGKYGGGLTGLAVDLGAAVKTQLDLDALKAGYADAQAKIAAARVAKDIDTMFAEASRSQLFKEAIETATGEGPSEGYIQKTFDPSFRSPLKAQFEPPPAPAAAVSKRAIVAPPMSQAEAEKIADAIYKAEGGAKAKKPYGILSVKVKDEADARRVAINTIRNNWKRWNDAGRPGEYLEFLAKRYAPVGAENDPKGFNQNWLKNVRAILNKKP